MKRLTDDNVVDTDSYEVKWRHRWIGTPGQWREWRKNPIPTSFVDRFNIVLAVVGFTVLGVLLLLK